MQDNPRVYKALPNQMAEIHEQLKRLEKCSGENDELLYAIQLIAETTFELSDGYERFVFFENIYPA